MIHTEAPQNVKHKCSPEEFKEFERGARTFLILERRDGIEMEVGDWITMEEVDSSGEVTGHRILFQISTKEVIGEEPVYEVLGFVPPEFGSLDALYNEYVTVSLVIDRFEDPETGKDTNSLLTQPAYTPQLACPDLVQIGLLNSLHAEKWPRGRYSVTLLLQLDVEEENPNAIKADIQDTLILTYVQTVENERDIVFVELDWTALLGGHAINVLTESKVTPCEIDTLAEILGEAASTEDLEGHEELLSEEMLRQLVQEAKEQGEDVGELEKLLRFRPEDIEEDEQQLDPTVERIMNLKKEGM